LFVDPRELNLYSAGFKRRDSGTVQSGDWDLSAIDIGCNRWVAACVAHWRDGVPWDETGIITHDTHLAETRGYNRCWTRKDVIARYELLDDIFKQVKAEGRLRTAYELGVSRREDRERDGVYVHFGRHGEPIFGGLGSHRLGMALTLGLRRIPACFGVVHVEARDRVLGELLGGSNGIRDRDQTRFRSGAATNAIPRSGRRPAVVAASKVHATRLLAYFGRSTP
jgi:hypothetical protein